jgi:asparagine synthase (glutamine-hydrolysing)
VNAVCGICGLVAPSGTADPALVSRMNAALVHRGPDEGSVDVFGRCVLGHRRLQVIDLETGSQPVASESREVVAVFNGELYDFRELRAELAAAGHDVRGTGDTPVIPHLYEQHGLGFVEHLSGMFAVALWDASRDRLVLARDHVGKKPIVWTRLPDGSLAFASEVKALLQLDVVRREPDPAQLDAYLALQYVPGGTGLAGIEKLPPGHLLVLEGGDVRVEPYARVGELEARSDAEWLELVRAEVVGAVRRRLVADVPLGALLSGGIDSSVVVALMAHASSQAVRTFTVGFGEPRYDERAFAREVAGRYATEHEEVVLTPDVSATLPRLAEAYDEPHGDEAALPLFLICEAARREVTVALTGDGGDESFGGYERYLAYELAGKLPSAGAGTLAAGLRRVSSEPRSAAARAARFLEMVAAPPGERYGRIVEVFPAALRAELWEPGFVPRPRPAWELLGPPAGSGIAGLQRLDVRTYLPGDLLLKADIASMAHSLELRSPLLDRRVLEVGLSLPDRLKAGSVPRDRPWDTAARTKVALRRAFEADLPAQVAARGKKGFGVPLSAWFRGELRELAHDVLLDRTALSRGQLRPAAVERLLDDHAAGRADNGHRLWCLVMLELWQRTWVEAARRTETSAALS